MDDYVRPHSDSAALLTIDVQNDVSLPGAPFEVEGTAEAIPRMQRLVETFRKADAPIVHVVRLYRANGSNVDPCRKAWIESGANVLRSGTEGAELVDALKPATDISLDTDRLLGGGFQPIGPKEWMMYKPRWSAFYRTDLDGFLDDRSIDTVVVCGCNFPNCPRTTIYEASEREYRIVLVTDATSGTYERGLDEVANIGGAVKSSEEAVEWMDPTSRA